MLWLCRRTSVECPVQRKNATIRSRRLVTADIGEPSQQSIQGFSYFATYTEIHTRRKLLFLWKKKSDVREHTKTALNRISTQFNVAIKRFKPDGAKEFAASDIRAYCNEKGILFDPSTRYTPQENSDSRAI